MSESAKKKLDYVKPQVVGMGINSGIAGDGDCFTGTGPAYGDCTNGGSATTSCATGSGVLSECMDGNTASLCYEGSSYAPSICEFGGVPTSCVGGSAP